MSISAPHPSPTRSERAQRTRQRILDAAGHCFAEGDYAKTTVERIALQAGVSKALLYNHFPVSSGQPGPIVHRSALLTRDGRTSVWRVSGRAGGAETVERVPVRVGLMNRDRAQISHAHLHLLRGPFANRGRLPPGTTSTSRWRSVPRRWSRSRLTPMLASRMLRRNGESGRLFRVFARAQHGLDEGYRWLLLRALRHKGVTVLVGVAAVAGGGFVASTLAFDLHAQDDLNEGLVRAQFPIGTPPAVCRGAQAAHATRSRVRGRRHRLRGRPAAGHPRGRSRAGGGPRRLGAGHRAHHSHAARR